MNVAEKTKMIDTKTSRLKVLIVDDEESIRLSLREFLRDAHYEVCVAQDADEAMAKLAAEDFDVVVTDIIMPRITGVKLLKAIKEASPHVQVILMTGEPAVETASEAVRAGAYDYLTKPIGKEDILKVVANAARVKVLDDERRRLEEENHLYQENLEQLVEERSAALSKKTAFLDSILRSSMDLAIVATDTDFRITYYNPTAERQHGYTAEEVIGKTLMEIYTKENMELERFEKAVETVKKEGEYCYEIVQEKEDGTHYLDSRVSGIYDENKKLVGFLSSSRDITEKRRTVEQIKASLKEKETLLKEIHHRVKNNLQVISSILNLQAGHIEDREFKGLFKESQDRIRCMALVHAQLYQSNDLSNISLSEYIKSLIANIIESYAYRPSLLNLKIDAEEIQLDIDTAIVLGLILNELCTNVLKYAFPEGRQGELKIDFKSSDNNYLLVVSDNGVGLPDDFEIDKANSMGFLLIESMVKQLDGTLEIDQSSGTSFRIIFPRQSAH